MADLVERLMAMDAKWKADRKRIVDLEIDATFNQRRITALEAEVARLREALHEIDIEAGNTIPPDGKEAAFAALFRIAQIINPFRLPRAALETKHD